MIFELLLGNNMRFDFASGCADFIFCDPVYEDLVFQGWVDKYLKMLKPNGIFCVITDFHSDYKYREYLEDHATFVNHLVWKNEWGNYPKNKYHACFDSILIYCNGKNWNFYPEKIQVPKVTINKGLNPSGRIFKPATAWIDDCALTTTSKERVKKKDGHLVRWQKPQSLYDRIIPAFTSPGDLIIDPFMGSGSLGRWCKKNKYQYIGIEIDKEIYELAKNNVGVI
jgi:DNA modification methylase